MYILFINSGDRNDIFFSSQSNNNSNKIFFFNMTQPDPCGLGWVRLNFFQPTMVGWVKNSR